MSAYSSVVAHYDMVVDSVRNKAYADALEKCVTSGSVVVDLGAGLGTHGLMAAKFGARRVYLIDREAIIEVASRIARDNGLQDIVECRHGRIQEVSLPEKADIIVSVFTGNFLLTEDLLPSLFLARDKFLKPGGSLIPDRAVMHIVPVDAAVFHDKNIAAWSKDTLGHDFSAARQYAANWVFYDHAAAINAEFLAMPATLMELDFMTANKAECRNQVEVIVNRDGVCHGCLGWFDMHLGDEWLSTSPKAEKMHWSQAFLPLDPPIKVSAGDRIRIDIDRPEHGEWTWTVMCGDKTQRHSTFLAKPVLPGELAKRAKSFAPGLSRKGEAAHFLLSRMDGNHQAASLGKEVFEAFPELFLTTEEAARFVKQLVSWWA